MTGPRAAIVVTGSELVRGDRTDANGPFYAREALTLGLVTEVFPAAELLERKPDYSCSFAREDLFFCANQGFIERYAEGLRRAGVPA